MSVSIFIVSVLLHATFVFSDYRNLCPTLPEKPCNPLPIPRHVYVDITYKRVEYLGNTTAGQCLAGYLNEAIYRRRYDDIARILYTTSVHGLNLIQTDIKTRFEGDTHFRYEEPETEPTELDTTVSSIIFGRLQTWYDNGDDETKYDASEVISDKIQGTTEVADRICSEADFGHQLQLFNGALTMYSVTELKKFFHSLMDKCKPIWDKILTENKDSPAVELYNYVVQIVEDPHHYLANITFNILNVDGQSCTSFKNLGILHEIVFCRQHFDLKDINDEFNRINDPSKTNFTSLAHFFQETLFVGKDFRKIFIQTVNQTAS